MSQLNDDINTLVAECNAILYSDSRIILDEDEIVDAMKADYALAGRFPTKSELIELIEGNDEGEVQHADVFVFLNALIASQF